MNKKIRIIGVLIIVLVTFASGCIETPVEDVPSLKEEKTPVEDVTIETLNRINIKLDKAEIELDISWDAVKRKDYEIAKQHVYNARRYVAQAFRYFENIQAELTESERIRWKTIFELRRARYDLFLDTIHWLIETEKITEMPKEEKEEVERLLIVFELHIQRTEELANAWEQHITKLEFIKRTQPDIGITDEIIRRHQDLYMILNTYAEDGRILINELKQVMQEYITIDNKIVPHPIDISPVRREIIARDLPQFFDSFDTDGDGVLNVRESQDFFYWVENNIIYRPDTNDEKSGIGYIQTPYTTFAERAGDCEDMAILQVAFFNHFGISAYIALVDTTGGREMNHALAIVMIDGTPEEFMRRHRLARIAWFEIEGEYYMMVDNAYSNAFGYICSGEEERFRILRRLTLEEVLEH